jgi:Flp pilus assembly protein TadG
VRRRNQSGHAILELAICAAMMVSCLAGTFQFGYTFYVYNLLVASVGNGGRYAATRTYHGGSEQQIEQDRQAIRNMVVYGDAQPASDATPVTPKLTTEQVDVRWVFDQSSDKKGPPTAVNVSIREYSVDAVFKTFTFMGRPGVEFPYIGGRQ